MKIFKIIIVGLVSLFTTVANAATIFVPTDTDINFILETGDLSNATLAIFDEAADIGNLSLGLEVTAPELISWDGIDTLSGTNGNLTIDGDFVIAAICSQCGNIWTGGDIDYGSQFTVPESNTYAIVFDGIEGFELTADVSPVPVPAAVWLFGSGLIGLIGVARRKKV